MPELRKDPVVGRWVIISTDRAKRPSDFRVVREQRLPDSCALCEGRESETPPEVYAVRRKGTAPDTPGWDVRVVPNKYPALCIEGELNREGVGMCDMMNGVGAHEVIIETPEHGKDLVDLATGHIAEVIWTYRQRIMDLSGDDRLKYVLIFKNQGEAAGASLQHAHSQLIATPITPKRVKEELMGAMEHYSYKRRCIFCDYIKQETKVFGERLVAKTEHFVTLSPFAARFPFELWILPQRHAADFTYIENNEVTDLAKMLKLILEKLRVALNDPPFNYILHMAPFRRRRVGYWATIEEDYHWHIELLPRLSRVAGFERGSGFYINPTPPEVAAQVLRDTEVFMMRN
jgi:UDPglucose--hexose-1-phosphate uridylyltransferase